MLRHVVPLIQHISFSAKLGEHDGSSPHRLSRLLKHVMIYHLVAL